jgi:hypothetical protein
MKIKTKFLARNREEFLGYFKSRYALNHNMHMLAVLVKTFILIVGLILFKGTPLVLLISLVGTVFVFYPKTFVDKKLNKIARKRFFKKYQVSKKHEKDLVKAVKKHGAIVLDLNEELFNEAIGLV